MKNSSKLLTTLLLCVPMIASAFGGPKSGLQMGDPIPPFEPTHVTGADAGTKTCPVCKYGKTPAVQVWVNGDSMENVSKIADALEAAIKMDGPDKLKAFILFIKPADESEAMLEGKLKMISDKCHLQNVALAYVDGGDAGTLLKYKINTASDIKNTVLVYHDMKISANFVNLKGDEEGLMSLKSAMMEACGM